MFQIKKEIKKTGKVISWKKEEDFMIIYLKKSKNPSEKKIVHKIVGEKLIKRGLAVEVKGKTSIEKPKLNIKK